MALPTSRDITVNPGDPTPSTLLDKLQDLFVGRKRASGTKWVNPSVPNILNAAGTQTMGAGTIAFGAAGKISGLPLATTEDGERITAFSVRLLGAGSQTLKYDLMLNQGGGTTVSLGQLQIVNPPATWATYSLTLATPHAMLAGESLYLDTIAQGALVGTTLGPVGITLDRL